MCTQYAPKHANPHCVIVTRIGRKRRDGEYPKVPFQNPVRFWQDSKVSEPNMNSDGFKNIPSHLLLLIK